MIDNQTIRRIKEVARIDDVILEFCSLKRVGAELTCACPFHIGQSLNHFKVNPDQKKNFYHCFVCGVHGGPIDFLMDYAHLSYPDALRWLGHKYSIPVDDGDGGKTFQGIKKVKPRPMKTLPQLPMLVLPLELVQTFMRTDDNVFCNWLRGLPWNDQERRRVEQVLQAYGVGTTRNGRTVFWQIDEQGRCHTGKVMPYLPDGHRDKSKNTTWVHSILAAQHRDDLYDPMKQEVKTYLFGMHLVNMKGDYGNTLNIVESEKTAIIMTIYAGVKAGLWIATGGLQFLKKETFDHLRALGFRIIFHPDHDGESRWRELLTKYGYQMTDDFNISMQFVSEFWRPVDGEKADAADVIIRRIQEEDNNNPASIMKRWREKYPNFALLEEKFGLRATGYTAATKTG